MLISLSGKGGTGKTTLTAILTDEILRHRSDCRLLVIDADPAMTLSMALDVISPAWTLADVRDSTPLCPATTIIRISRNLCENLRKVTNSLKWKIIPARRSSIV